MSCLPLSPTASAACCSRATLRPTSIAPPTASSASITARLCLTCREDITDRAGIAHCTQAQAAELMACVEGARAAHHAYSVDVLVPNRRETLEAFPEIPCDRATIDDYLRLMLKGASK